MATELPSKKQRALLAFIDGFIKENGFAPSYREVMRALEYRSVSTVAKHIDGLITRGWLVKRDNSARSVEVRFGQGTEPKTESSPAPSLSLDHEEWLTARIREKLAAVPDDNARQAIHAALAYLDLDAVSKNLGEN